MSFMAKMTLTRKKIVVETENINPRNLQMFQ